MNGRDSDRGKIGLWQKVPHLSLYLGQGTGGKSMATINQDEILASIKLLVCMAKADGKLLEEEREGLRQSFQSLALPEGITLDSLLAEDLDPDQLIPQITSETAREAVYQAAYLMANIDGDCSPEEQHLLDRIAHAFAGFQPFGYESWLANQETRATKSTLAYQMKKILDSEQRHMEVERLIMDACFFNAVFGAFPLPGVAILLDLLIYWNQLALVQTIGERWGYTAQNEDLKKALFGSLGVTGARIAFSNLAKLVPVVGMIAGATTAYATTWAIGKVANQYYAEGCKMDKFKLQEVFKLARQEGEALYKQNADAIAARRQALEPKLEELTREFRAGKITPEEYQEKLQAFTIESQD